MDQQLKTHPLMSPSLSVQTVHCRQEASYPELGLSYFLFFFSLHFTSSWITSIIHKNKRKKLNQIKASTHSFSQEEEEEEEDIIDYIDVNRKSIPLIHKLHHSRWF